MRHFLSTYIFLIVYKETYKLFSCESQASCQEFKKQEETKKQRKNLSSKSNAVLYLYLEKENPRSGLSILSSSPGKDHKALLGIGLDAIKGIAGDHGQPRSIRIFQIESLSLPDL